MAARISPIRAGDSGAHFPNPRGRWRRAYMPNARTHTPRPMREMHTPIRAHTRNAYAQRTTRRPCCSPSGTGPARRPQGYANPHRTSRRCHGSARARTRTAAHTAAAPTPRHRSGAAPSQRRRAIAAARLAHRTHARPVVDAEALHVGDVQPRHAAARRRAKVLHVNHAMLRRR